MDWSGLEWIEMDWIGVDWSGLEWIGMDLNILEWIWKGLEYIWIDCNGVEWIGMDLEWMCPPLMERSPARSSWVAALMQTSYSSVAFSLLPLHSKIINMLRIVGFFPKEYA